MLRRCCHTPAGFECEKITGWRARSITSIVVRKPVWLQQATMPTRSISASTCPPNSVSPVSSSWQPPPSALFWL
jgi:hypothetical protein